MSADPKLMDTIAKILRAEFPNDTVDVSASGVGDNIHVIVVSRKFDAMKNEKQKQDYLWDLIDKSKLSEKQKLCMSLILPTSPADIKY